MKHKTCKKCNAVLMGNEKLGKKCNKCLDKAAAETLAEYEKTA